MTKEGKLLVTILFIVGLLVVASHIENYVRTNGVVNTIIPPELRRLE